MLHNQGSVVFTISQTAQAIYIKYGGKRQKKKKKKKVWFQ